jgi:hypothetical protein
VQGWEEESSEWIMGYVHVSIGFGICRRLYLLFEEHETAFIGEAMFGAGGDIERLGSKCLDGIGVEGFDLHGDIDQVC